MADLSSSAVEGEKERPCAPATRTRANRRDWSTGSALLFWIGASGAIWLALAASAIWMY